MSDAEQPCDAAPIDGPECPADSRTRQPTTPVKTTPDGRPIKRNVPAEQWETVGRRAICDVLLARRDAIDREIRQVVSAVEYGAPLDATHFENLRGAIEVLELTVEADLAELVPGAEPWERTVGRIPAGSMWDSLGIDRDELAQLRELKSDSGPD